jgi:hypothetical protein
MYKDQQITDIFHMKIEIPFTLKHFSWNCLFMNDGTGNFKKTLEKDSFTGLCRTNGDYNGDGNPDILLGGNLYNVKPEVGRYDASYGTFLAGDGTGGFSVIPAKISGFDLKGEVRDIMEINTSTGKLLVIARSNDSLQVFKILNR